MLMVDISALAARYASVAAALAKAGLTAPQHEAYRVALISARVAASLAAERIRDMNTPAAIANLTANKGVNLGDLVGRWDTSSVQAKNVAFLNAHADEVQALEATGMWSTP